MPIGFEVLSTRDVDPVVATVGGFENQLVEVAMRFEEVKPLVGNVHVGVGKVVVPIGVRSLWKLDVSCFTEGVLAGVCATDFDVELVATVAAGDVDGLTGKGAERLQDGLAELLENRNVLRWAGVVNAIGDCGCTSLEFCEGEVFC